jgi:predicted O-linked N-acetylglucosamine transferase (SPINDLY family)
VGVPVVTLAGAPGETLQRCGVSILTNVGHPEWIAATPDDYIAKARALANDLPRLAEIRAALRPRMRSSVLMDAPRFARNVETAFRQAWKAWAQR